MANAIPQRRKEVAEKLPRLPKNAKVQKRPLIHAAIPSPFAGRDHQKIVYVSSKTPFISAFRRVEKLFKLVEKRTTQSEIAHHQNRRRKGRSIQTTTVQKEKPESVIIKATGKAVDKALSLGLFIQELPGYEVKITTSSVAAIDDIELSTSAFSAEIADGKNGSLFSEREEPDALRTEVDVVEDEETEIPESRIRLTSVIEIHVTMR